MVVGARAEFGESLWLLAGSILVGGLAVVLRLRGLPNRSFWPDAAMHVDCVRRGFRQMWSALVLDRVHPPRDLVAGWLGYRF